MSRDAINTEVQSCHRLFQELLTILSGRDYGQEQEQALQHEFSRFKLWVDNIGAHKKGHRSLDHRLRYASHIRDAVMKMLRGLHEVLSESIKFTIVSLELDCLRGLQQQNC